MSDNNTKEMDELIKSWRDKLTTLAKRPKGVEWLQLLYSSYLSRFLSDNNRIWTTGQLMIPLALAPIAAVTTLKGNLSVLNLLVLAIPSVSLIWLWLVIAENHRGLQEKSEQWLNEIENVLNIKKPGGPKADGVLVQPGMIRRVRWWLAWGITIFWSLLIAYVWFTEFW